MIVLGFDTATPATAVGLRLTDGSMLEARDDPGEQGRPGHATRLLPLAAGLLVQAGIAWGALERIAVGVGPGTFTGLRIGVTSARGLAQSLGVDLVGVSSPRALAQMASRQAERQDGAVLAVIDARRGEVFLAAYDGDEELLPPRPIAPQDLNSAIERVELRTGIERWIAAGDGAVRYREALERPNVRIPDIHSPLHRVAGEAICMLGERATVGDAAKVVPDYRRRPDAELALEGAGS
jgi:tRNA threonylcarbamoyladenosine biosynthesis protein TsaB